MHLFTICGYMYRRGDVYRGAQLERVYRNNNNGKMLEYKC